jgi:lysosomal Pro-X carboxypeptidase
VPVNHFTTNNTNVQTYQMRYLLDESHVQANDTYPPILFYCGNEGDVWTFYNNSGFMTTTLPNLLNAVVLFGEHRYYGESLPFGEQSFTKDNVKYLTLDQTFMDYQLLIKTIKDANPKYKYSPVFAFGGSYGGMLAAWMRMKFPHVIHGAHASSAPIMFFPGSVSPYAFNELVTRQWEKVKAGTKQSVFNGFMALKNFSTDASKWETLDAIFNTCESITLPEQVNLIGDMINNAIGTMQMVDYPYATDFLGSLPANPVNTTIGWMYGNVSAIATDMDYVRRLQVIINVFQNSTGQTNCTDISFSSVKKEAPGLDDNGWNYQVCNEMVMPIQQNGITDMFPKDLWNADAFVAGCKKSTGLNP